MARVYDRNALFSVEGLVVVITGGGSGLGAVIAHALDENGAKTVYILGRRQDALYRTVKSAKNGNIKGIVCDVTSKDSLAAAAEQIRREVGYIDVLHANSGVIGPSVGKLSPDKPLSIKELHDAFWDVPMEDFTRALHVNVTGVFYTTLAFLELLDAGNRRAGATPQKSQVIVTGSVAAFARSPATGFSYGASKASVTHMAKQLATTLAPYKIRANVVAPGFFPSEMTDELPFMKGHDPRVEGSLPTSLHPLQRVGTEEEIAGVALFLMSRAGAFMNGAVELLDGGRLATVPATY